ncbi:MAG: phosphatase PAP2 family protein [Pirellulales bacterium]
MSKVPPAWMIMLLVSHATCLSGCTTNPRPRSELANDTSVDASFVVEDRTGGFSNQSIGAVSELDIVRLPPVEGPAVQQASANIPVENGYLKAPVENQVWPIGSEFGPPPLPISKHSPFFNNETAIWRLPPVADLASDDKDHETTFREMFKEQGKGILEDYSQFYSMEGLTWLAAGVGVGALMANTAFDEHLIRHTFEENVVLAPTHEYAELLGRPKFFGEGLYTIPVFAIAALSEPLIEDLPLGEVTAEWGQRSFRTLLVGAPPMLALQVLTGASRPGESSSTSYWKPLNDNNGVSGHSFMGAVPFLSAAMMSDNIWLKSGLYVASTLPGWSRVNDDDHYFSQAFLGWWLAFMAASAVDRSHDPERHHHYVVYPQGDGVVVGLEYNH